MDECQNCSGGPVHHPAASAVNRLLFIHSHTLCFTRIGSYMHVLTFTHTHTREPTPTSLYHFAKTIAAVAFPAVARCQPRAAHYQRVTLTAAPEKGAI